MEPLERRQMLSASPAAARKALSKLDSNLSSAFLQYQQFAAVQATAAKKGGVVQPASAFAPTDSLLHTLNGEVQIQAYANLGYNKSLASAITRLKGQDVQINGREVDALLPINQLGKLASLSGLRFAQATTYSVNTGSVLSQGDAAVVGPTARASYNVSGAGIRVGILSDSFNNSSGMYTDSYSTDVTSGDLPSAPYVTVLNDNYPGTDEGRAMAQVIYDTAPNASFIFASGYGGYVSATSYLKAMASDGAKLIVDDYTYPSEPFFQDSVMSQEITALNASGVSYISAAGNFGENSYAANWSSGTTYSAGAFTNVSGATPFYGGTSFNFNTTGGVNDKQLFNLSNGQSVSISFQWDQPYYSISGGSGCANQADIYVLNSANQIVGGSANLTVGKDPIQTFSFTSHASSPTQYKLMIVSEAGYALPGYIKYIDYAGQATNWTPVNNSSTVAGHANANGVETVGAANWNFGSGSPVLESYSSEGGTPILFNSAGGRLTGNNIIIRNTPAIVGPDDVATTFFGPVVNGLHSFSGTSAAAATVAGVVALLAQKNPSLTPAAIYGLLAQTAKPIQNPSTFLTGAGFVQAVPAISFAVGNVTGTVFSDNNADGIEDNGETGLAGVTVYLDLTNAGTYQAGDPTATTNSAGTYVLYNQPTGTAVIRAIAPAGDVALTSGRTVTIAGASNTSGVNFALFPDSYASTASGSNWVLQLNASNPSIVNVLLNNVLKYSAPLTSVPSLSFSLNGNNSSLTINYSNGSPIPSGGVTEAGIANGSNIALVINGTSANDTANLTYPLTTFDGSGISTSNITAETINGNGGNDAFTITAAQPATESLTFNGGVGNDTLTVNDILPNNGSNTYFNAGTNPSDQNTLNVNAGTWNFAGDPALNSSNLSINLGTSSQTVFVDGSTSLQSLFGTVVFQPGPLNGGIASRNIANLNIGFGDTVLVAPPKSHNDRSVLVVNGSLSISSGGFDVNNNPVAGGILDLNANDAVLFGNNINSITPLLSTGYNNGNWNGTGGITSSAAANDTTHLTALGSITAGSTFTTFDGQPVSPSTVLIKYTYYGDANLDGQVNSVDYSLIDNSFLQPPANPAWSNGDFNYDGTINGSDYTLIDNAFNMQGNNL